MERTDEWERLELYGADVAAWRHPSGRFRFRLAGAAGGATLEFGAENREALEALLLALADAKRALTGEDFVPAKLVNARATDADEVAVRFEPEDLEYLRARVRVGKEESLDGAVARAVKSYLRDRLNREIDEPERAPRPATRPRTGQSQLAGAEGPHGIGPIQRNLLALALKKGAITRLDVGRAYGITASKRNASTARTKAEGAVNALVARGLLRYELSDGDATWVLTEIGRTLVEEDAAR